MRALRVALFFCVGVLLAVGGGVASAETITATGSTATVAGYAASTGWGLTEVSACQAGVTTSNEPLRVYDHVAASPWQCWTRYNGAAPSAWANMRVSQGCTGSLVPDRTSCPTWYSCPSGQNWTLSGSSCTRPDCVSPQVRQSDGTCHAPCGAAGTKTTADYSGPEGTIPNYLCDPSGCQIQTTACVGGGTSGWACSSANYTGAFCTGVAGGNGATAASAPSESVVSDTAQKACVDKGMYFGTVNGVTVCVSASTSKSTTASSGSMTPPGGTTGTTNVSNTTVCGGDGSCTTTTTTTVTGGGTTGNQTNGTTTATSTQTKGAFCTANPSDTQCTAKAGDCDKNSSLIGCQTIGSPGDSTALGDQNKTVSAITPTTTAAGSCPASVSLPKGAQFEFTPMCNFAGGIRPVVLAIAWLLAGGMLFAYFRS